MFDLHGEGEPKAGPLPILAFHVKLSVHQLNQLPSDRQPQSGASILAGHGVISLHEGLKNALQSLLFNADACILDLKTNPAGVTLNFLRVDHDLNLTPFGELDGIADEVVEDLLKAHLVPKDLRG